MPRDQYLAQSPAPRRLMTYSVTFEYDYRPPVTHRGAVAASRIGTGARMAVESAARVLRPARWRSAVLVITGDGSGARR
jgi:hypothetical protein